MKISEAIKLLQDQLDLSGDDYLYTDNATKIGIKKGCGCCIDPVIYLSDIDYLN